MKISKYFKLGRDQASLDFVDVDYNRDTRLFLSPKALANLPSDWGDECVHLVQDFFKTVLGHIKAGRHGAAEDLLLHLKEPNETHLGLSKGKSRGRALGDRSAHDVWQALTHSKAAKSGLITDLEDTALLIDGIGVDIISDITTNIIRGPLIQYTQQMCAMHAIKMRSGVPSGPMWEPQTKKWVESFVDLPMTPVGRILFVPKAIVRLHLAYNLDDYYRNHLLAHLRGVELNANSSLVTVIKKTKEKKIYSKDLKKKYGDKKSDIVRETLANPDVFEKYKSAKDMMPFDALGHEALAAAEGIAKPDWPALISAITQLPTGKADAGRYEEAVEALLTALFYPALTNPVSQHKLHNGRKRIDITFVNMAASGFFRWLSLNYPAMRIAVECKNYEGDIANPELDQMIGRFSPSRGRIGIIVCRSFNKKEIFQQRCKDTAKDNNGFIMVLDDADLAKLVEYRRNASEYMLWDPLKKQFDALID